MEQKKKKLNPASLSKEDQEAVVEYYLGVHPKYFNYFGTRIEIDIWNFSDTTFQGFKPFLKEIGRI